MIESVKNLARRIPFLRKWIGPIDLDVKGIDAMPQRFKKTREIPFGQVSQLQFLDDDGQVTATVTLDRRPQQRPDAALPMPSAQEMHDLSFAQSMAHVARLKGEGSASPSLFARADLPEYKRTTQFIANVVIAQQAKQDLTDLNQLLAAIEQETKRVSAYAGAFALSTAIKADPAYDDVKVPTDLLPLVAKYSFIQPALAMRLTADIEKNPVHGLTYGRTDELQKVLDEVQAQLRRVS